MGYLKIGDDLLRAKHITGDWELRDRIVNLPAGGSVDLEIDGMVGHWEKAKLGKNGRATDALNPVGPMREIWKRFQARRGEIVKIRETRTADSYLKAISETM